MIDFIGAPVRKDMGMNVREVGRDTSRNRLGHPGNTHHSSKDRLSCMAVVKISCYVWQLGGRY